MLRRHKQEQSLRSENNANREWIYFGASESNVQSLEQASAAKGAHPAQKSFSNDDIQRLNDQNGAVHYDGKTEKIQ